MTSKSISVYDFPKMRVDEIRKILINKYKLTPEYVNNISGKAALVAELQNILKKEDNTVVKKEQKTNDDIVDFGNDEDSTGDFEVEQDNLVAAESTDTPEPPQIGDYGWHNYIMTQFEKDELFKDNPTVDGMRRLVEEFISNIMSIDTTVVQVPTPPDRRATVVVKVRLADDTIWSGAADVYSDNTDEPFCRYPVATAETIAEGRAYKRILRLRKVHTAEEISAKVNIEQEVEKSFITDTQLKFLELMCSKDRLDINILKLIESEGFEVKDVNMLTHQNALTLNERLSEYQQKKENIPKELIGYDSNWRNS